MVETGAFWARLFRPMFFLIKKAHFLSPLFWEIWQPLPLPLGTNTPFWTVTPSFFLQFTFHPFLPPLKILSALLPPHLPQNFGYKSRRFELGSSSFSPGLQNRDRLIQKTNYFLFPRKRRRKSNFFLRRTQLKRRCNNDEEGNFDFVIHVWWQCFIIWQL